MRWREAVDVDALLRSSIGGKNGNRVRNSVPLHSVTLRIIPSRNFNSHRPAMITNRLANGTVFMKSFTAGTSVGASR